jgi:hypothetical protein
VGSRALGKNLSEIFTGRNFTINGGITVGRKEKNDPLPPLQGFPDPQEENFRHGGSVK